MLTEKMLVEAARITRRKWPEPCPTGSHVIIQRQWDHRDRWPWALCIRCQMVIITMSEKGDAG